MATKDWEKIWQEEPKPKFDQGHSAEALVDLLKKDIVPKGGKVLVPGCGRGYDVILFSKSGYDAMGLEYSPSGAKAAQEYISANYDLSKVTIEVGDFFEFKHSPFDFIYDYTFFCAISLDNRENWGKQMQELIKPGGHLITLLFPVIEREQETTPPYQVHIPVMKALLEKNKFQNIFLEQVPPERNSPGREGLEWIAVWKRLE